MSHLSRLCAAAAVIALAGTAVGPATVSAASTDRSRAGAAARSLDPATLPMGPRPQRAYLVGRRLTTPQGTTFTVPFPRASAGGLTLLGRSPQGYVVERDDGGGGTPYSTVAAYTVKKTGHHVTKHLVDHFTYDVIGFGAAYTLSHDGTRVALIGSVERGVGPDIDVLTTIGTKVASNSFGYYGSILDVSGSEIVTTGSDDGSTDEVRDLVYGSAPTPVDAAGADAADLTHGVLFAYDATSGSYGPTSLSSPAAPPWTSGDSDWRVSPGGDLVVGYDGTRPRVHRMSDGVVVSAPRLDVSSHLLTWDSATTYLAVATGPSGSAVVRCDAMTGSCRRTTKVFASRLTMTRT